MNMAYGQMSFHYLIKNFEKGYGFDTFLDFLRIGIMKRRVRIIASGKYLKLKEENL